MRLQKIQKLFGGNTSAGSYMKVRLHQSTKFTRLTREGKIHAMEAWCSGDSGVREKLVEALDMDRGVLSVAISHFKHNNGFSEREFLPVKLDIDKLVLKDDNR